MPCFMYAAAYEDDHRIIVYPITQGSTNFCAKLAGFKLKCFLHYGVCDVRVSVLIVNFIEYSREKSSPNCFSSLRRLGRQSLDWLHKF